MPRWSLWRRSALPAAAVAWGTVIVLARRGVTIPDRALDGVTVVVASSVKVILGWIGLAVSQNAAFLYLPGGFSYVVGSGCTGLVPSAVLAVGILAAPATRAARVWGLLVAVPLALLLNLVRLAHLFYIGVNDPREFALAHEVLWEIALVTGVVGIWSGWWKWASRALAPRPH
jgi:exosortase/archaeosortase family protein